MNGPLGVLFLLGFIGFVFLVLMRFLKSALDQRAAIRMKEVETQGGSIALTTRLEALEKRMANLETITLEREKVNEFDRALR
jgi:hypothetical protein